jgi:hypothetical protein
MALSLTEAAKYTTNMVKRGVIEVIIRDSPVLQKLKFMDVVGNAVQYLRESTLPTAEFYDPNELWAESTGDKTQHTAVIKILGGDADIDNFLKKTRSNYTDIEAETISDKAKAVKHTFLDRFYYGNSATSTKEFDGLHTIFAGSDMTAQQVHEGSAATGSALNATSMDSALDLVLGGKPDVIMMTRAVRRRVKQFLRAQANVELNFRSYSQDATHWGDVPIFYDDFLTQTETISSSAYAAKTGGATSSIFFLSFGQKALMGLQNGGLETVKIGQIQNKDGVRYRIKWYCGMASFSSVKQAIIDGVTDAAMAA